MDQDPKAKAADGPSEEEAEEQRRADTALWRQRKRQTRYQRRVRGLLFEDERRGTM